jgi:hypothetical protein
MWFYSINISPIKKGDSSEKKGITGKRGGGLFNNVKMKY